MIKRVALLSLAAFVFCTGFKMPDLDKVSKAVDAGADAYKAATLTEADIKQLGKESADKLDKLNKIDKSGKYAQRLAKITKGMTKEDGLKLNFQVYLVTDINAFALPDGSVRVFAGLMDMMTDDEILFVVGHEIGHVKNGDSMDAFRVAYAASAARKGAAASKGSTGKLSDSEFGELTERLINAQFSQKQESAADVYGFNLMKKYKKDTAAAVSALNKLASLGSNDSFLSSHPDSKKRAQKLAEMRKK